MQLSEVGGTDGAGRPASYRVAFQERRDFPQAIDMVGRNHDLAPRHQIPYIYTVTLLRHASRLRRAALPVELLVPARRVASRGIGRARAGAGVRGARDHRRMLGRRCGARAFRGEERGPGARNRQRVHAHRRHEARAARDRPRELWQPRAAHHARTTAGEERHLRARARRRPAPRRRPACAVGAAGRRAPAGRRRHRCARDGALGRHDVSGSGVDRRRALRARRRPGAARALRASFRGRADCRRSPPATSTCTPARGVRCRTR